ncbi:MAG: hypothetical protein BWY79_01958 [Actinobacteria bacterium ADurb.Bin444]|nr:MAG: hypothetical protein BWY79_01958 [Actinobacteria bacterium ADurb.Bin444]
MTVALVPTPAGRSAQPATSVRTTKTVKPSATAVITPTDPVIPSGPVLCA